MKFVISYLFSVSPGFFHGRYFSLPITFKNLFFFVFSNNFKKNKYSTTIYFIIFFYKIISIFYIPVGLLLYWLNFRIAIADAKSFGAFIEEIENIYRLKKNKKLIIFAPKLINANVHLKYLFKRKDIYFLESNILFLFITPCSYLNFLSINPYMISTKKKHFFLRQEINQNLNYNNIVNVYEFFYSQLLKSKKVKFNVETKKNELQKILKKLNIKRKKILMFNVRNSKNAKLRNSKIKNYYPALKFLVSKGYFIINVSNKNLKLPKKNCYVNLRKFEKFEYYQIKLLSICNLYFGTGGGPSHLFTLLNKKMLIIDQYPYFGFTWNDNEKKLFKKIYIGKKIISYFEAYKKNIHKNWSSKTNFKLEDNTPKEIYKFVKNNFNFSKKKKFIYLNIFKKNKILNSNLSLISADLSIQKYLYAKTI